MYLCEDCIHNTICCRLAQKVCKDKDYCEKYYKVKSISSVKTFSCESLVNHAELAGVSCNELKNIIIKQLSALTISLLSLEGFPSAEALMKHHSMEVICLLFELCNRYNLPPNEIIEEINKWEGVDL